MRLLSYLILLAVLSACAEGGRMDLGMLEQTAPGAPIADLTKWQAFRCMPGKWVDLKCTQWTDATDKCLNPKGLEGVPLIVPCASIKKSNNQ